MLLEEVFQVWGNHSIPGKLAAFLSSVVERFEYHFLPLASVSMERSLQPNTYLVALQLNDCTEIIIILQPTVVIMAAL